MHEYARGAARPNVIGPALESQSPGAGGAVLESSLECEEMNADVSHLATVLVVEEDTETRAGMRALLERRGFHVLEAATDQEAERVGPRRPDLIVTNFGLPTLELLKRRVREGVNLRGVPIVIVSVDDLGAVSHEGVLVLEQYDDVAAVLREH
jgi:CheY-like chemotaxis protein